MTLNQRFDGLSIDTLSEIVWQVGPPNSVATGTTAFVDVSSRCLTAGAVYELEAAAGSTDDAAQEAAAIQDTLMAASQLRPPINAMLLGERSVRWKKLQPVEVPSVDLRGGPVRRRFDLSDETSAVLILEDPTPYRRAVAELRGRGWAGAILLPGPIAGTSSVVIPRHYHHAGRVMIAYSFGRKIPVPWVERALGMRMFGYGGAAAE